MLPNFICIGAQKAGTTTISTLLERHPDVYMARPRETRFFVDDFRFGLGLQNYEISAFGAWNGQAAVGEKTPEYLLYDETPQRVADALGTDLRLIVCLRDPAHRAFSQFRHNLMLRVETLPFDDALALEANRTAAGRVEMALYGYRRRGLYAQRLEPWLERFGAERIFFVKFETDIAGAAAPSLPERLFRFLGVAPLETFPVSREGRPRAAVWSTAGEALQIEEDDRPVATIKAPSVFLRRFAQQAVAASPMQDRLSDAEATHLNQRYWAEDIARAASMTGLDLSDWL